MVSLCPPHPHPRQAPVASCTKSSDPAGRLMTLHLCIVLRLSEALRKLLGEGRDLGRSQEWLGTGELSWETGQG